MDQTKETAQSAQNKMGDTMQAGHNKASVSDYKKKLKLLIIEVPDEYCIRPSHEECPWN